MALDPDRELSWTKNRRKAAVLVAEGDLTMPQICKECSMGESTLASLKRHPCFAAYVEDIVSKFAAEIATVAVANRMNRLRAMDERWKQLRVIVENPAQTVLFDSDGAPVAVTGFDKEAYAALLALEKQVAQETGDWVERSTLDATGTGTPGGGRLTALSDAERVAGLRMLIDACRTRLALPTEAQSIEAHVSRDVRSDDLLPASHLAEAILPDTGGAGQ